MLEKLPFDLLTVISKKLSINEINKFRLLSRYTYSLPDNCYDITLNVNLNNYQILYDSFKINLLVEGGNECKNIEILNYKNVVKIRILSPIRSVVFNKIQDILPKLINLQSYDMHRLVYEINFDELKLIKELYLWNSALPDVNGISKIKNLQNLCINFGNRNVDMEDLLKCKELKKLKIIRSPSTLLFLNNLVKLEELSIMYGTHITDFSFFLNLQKLNSLYLNGVSLNNLCILNRCQLLKKLEILDSSISLQGLDKLKKIKELELQETSIYDKVEYNLISNLPNLTKLHISLTLLKNISFLRNLTKLKSLKLLNIKDLKDISPISKLVNLEILDLSSCKSIRDISHINKLVNLKRLVLFMCHEIKDISPISNLVNLELLNLTDCDISDILPLGKLVNLKILTLDSCRNVKWFSVLGKLIKLEKLDLSFTLLSDISFIKNMKNLEEIIITKCSVVDFTPILHRKNIRVKI